MKNWTKQTWIILLIFIFDFICILTPLIISLTTPHFWVIYFMIPFGVLNLLILPLVIMHFRLLKYVAEINDPKNKGIWKFLNRKMDDNKK